uniref:Replication termination factor 2 n=1 Tax=Alexandrium catenella TaxID=2925 RepID=A0A7S1SF48_ALECA
MGGDGGQVIDRGTMVKTKGWGFTKGAGDRYANSLGEMANYVQMVHEDRGLGPVERQRTRMTICRLSQEQLREPVVACRLGNLYNKEAVIAALLSKSIPAELSHIRALKDVKLCLLSWKEAENENGLRRMICPVTRQDLDDGAARAVLIWPTGAVVAAKAQKELKLSECPVTGHPFDREKDVIPLAPNKEELEALQAKLPQRKRKAASSSEAQPVVESSSREPAAPEKAQKAAASKEEPKYNAAKSEAYKSLFSKDVKEGFTGTYDPMGTPCYNRGSRIV